MLDCSSGNAPGNNPIASDPVSKRREEIKSRHHRPWRFTTALETAFPVSGDLT